MSTRQSAKLTVILIPLSRRSIFTRNSHIFHARFNSRIPSYLCSSFNLRNIFRLSGCSCPSSPPLLLNRFTFFLIFLISSVPCFSLFHPLSPSLGFPLCLRCHFVRTKADRNGERERGTIYSSYSSWCCSSEET